MKKLNPINVYKLSHSKIECGILACIVFGSFGNVDAHITLEKEIKISDEVMHRV